MFCSAEKRLAGAQDSVIDVLNVHDALALFHFLMGVVAKTLPSRFGLSNTFEPVPLN